VGFDLGVLYYRMGDVVTARRYFDAFLRQYPNHAACLEYRARMARDSGDYETALADFKRVFELQARPNPGHYISAAQMLGSTSDQGVDAALALLDQGMARLGTIPQLQRFAIELESARGNYQAALERLQSLQATEGSSPKWCADMGELLATMKRPQESQHWYLEAARQLQTQRKTPATLALQAQIQAALAALD
jgi:tetratricopeptide (TPR) repeat protein